MDASGGHLAAADKYATDYANTAYGNYEAGLQPFLGGQSTTASNMATNLTNLGGLATNQGTQLANLDESTATGIGTANAQLAQNTYAAQQGANSNIWGALGGLGTGLTKLIGGAGTATGAAGTASTGLSALLPLLGL
jgi:hypothetical protein